MTTNVKLISIGVAALLIGLLLGYLLFDKGGSTEHNHPTEVAAADAETWTCSMHPQIRQEEPGDCPLCGMDLIPLTASASDDPLVLQMTPEAAQLANIQTTVVGEGESAQTASIRLSGKVQADERLASSQVAHLPGRIEKLYVTFTGEAVRKGQKLAELYAPELIAAQRELLEARSLQEVSPGLLEAARKKLRYWKIPQTVIDQIESSGTVQETFALYASATGVVTERMVSVGDYVQQGEPLFSLINLRKVWVLFDAYEEDLAKIERGDVITFNTPALPEQAFTARVDFIDPVINPRTRVASIRVEVPNPQGQLKPEMLVYGNLEGKSSQTRALRVPKSAVMWTGPRSVVYVKVPDTDIPSFQYREVKIGEGTGDHYLLLGGLEPGEEVVTNGNFVIDAAAQLNNQASMMNQEVAIKGVDAAIELPDFTTDTPDAFKEQLAEVAAQYLLLKDALVATNPEAAQQLAGDLLRTLALVDMSLLSGKAHDYWMNQLAGLESHTRQLQRLDEVEAQREQFDYLSQALINSVKVFGIPADTFYVQHCPMAFDNTGAEWLSDEERIQNPYFGDKMLTCGVIQDVIQAEPADE